MKILLKIGVTTIVLLVMFIVDIPILPVELVPEAEAIYGVRRRTRRRTAVVVGSTTAAATASAEASQQQAYASQQEAAEAQQQAAEAQQQAAEAQQQAAEAQQQAAAQASSGVPLGTVVTALPAGCKAVTVGSTQYQDCGGAFYKTAFQGNNLVYVTVENPLQ